MKTSRKEKRINRKRRIRAKIFGTASKPRLAVFKSNKYIYAQVIDDEAEKTLAASDSKKLGSKTTTEGAKAVGAEIAKMAKEKKITDVIFDRGGFNYTGNVKLLADSAREAGLNF